MPSGAPLGRVRAGSDPSPPEDNALPRKPQDHQQVTVVLECIECHAQSAEALGWKAYLDREESEVWIYCAECAEREFAG